MSDLQTLLERSVDGPVDHDLAGDLDRGRRALRHRRRLVGGTVAALALVGGVVAGVLVRPDTAPPPPAHRLQATVRAGAFEIPTPPAGWSVLQADRGSVVIAPEGTEKPPPDTGFVVLGKLLVTYTTDVPEAPDDGPAVSYDGRTFFDLESGDDPRQVSVEVSPGRWLVIQEAPRLHWTLPHLIRYLDAVEVMPAAVPTDG